MYAKGKGSSAPSDAQAREKWVKTLLPGDDDDNGDGDGGDERRMRRMFLRDVWILRQLQKLPLCENWLRMRQSYATIWHYNTLTFVTSSEPA